MTDKQSAQPHGVLRLMRPGDQIEEGSFNNGKKHGLYRLVYSDRITIRFYVNGERAAAFTYRGNF